MRALILGVTGMLGHMVYRVFGDDDRYETFGTFRNGGVARRLDDVRGTLVPDVDVLDDAALERAFRQTRPAIVVNCVGIVKQLAAADDPLVAIPINALLPHRLERLCARHGARLIHVSTDCVFDGRRGNYGEHDRSDAEDLYGKSKHLGEVAGAAHAVTLRTSIIGPELDGRHALVEWFLAQHGPVRGFTRAIFSGLPTVELAHVMRDVLAPRPDLHGLYHVSAAPISKFELLQLIARRYGKDIEVVASDTPVIDRSLDSTRFRTATGYAPPAWPELIERMYDSRMAEHV